MLSSRAVAAGSRFPSCGSRDLWLSLDAFPQGFPTGLSHVPPWCESILGVKVEAVQGKQVSLERREEIQVRDTIPTVPQMSQSIPGKPVFSALHRRSSRGSTHTTVARATALWESLLGNSRGKASSESHRSLDPPLWKRDTAATAREESARACPHSR